MKEQDLLNRIYKLITTRRSNLKGLILNNFSMGKLWDKKYKDDEDLFLLTTLRQEGTKLLRTKVSFDTLEEVNKFINENWE